MRANEWPGCDLFGTSGNRSSGKGGRGAGAVHEDEGGRRWAQGGGFGMQAERTGRQVPFVAPKLAAGVGLVKVSAFVGSVCPPGLGAA